MVWTPEEVRIAEENHKKWRQQSIEGEKRRQQLLESDPDKWWNLVGKYLDCGG